MPEPARPRDAILTWVGAFVGIGVADMVFNIMNRSFAWRGQVGISHENRECNTPLLTSVQWL